MVLEKTLESPLDCKEIQPVYPKGDESWCSLKGLILGLKLLILWPPHGKSWLIGKDSDAWSDWGQEEKGTTEDEMAGWHHWLDGHEWVNSGSLWWTGRPGVLRFMETQRVRHDWANELNWTLWKESYDQLRQRIKKRHYFANKDPSSQGYGFSSGHVWMWELDYKESWEPKNWCFWTVVLEKTLESPLDCKEIQPVHPKGNQSWMFTGRTDVEAETPKLWPPDVKSWLIWKDPDSGKDWRQEEKGMTEDEMVGWHHQLDGHGFGWTLGVGDGQGGLVGCSSWVYCKYT